MPPVLHLVLFQPEIPQNTGNIGRLCAYANCRLHLIHPLGFRITDKHLKRSGMDYWHTLDVVHHVNWEAFEHAPTAPRRLWLFSTQGTRAHWDIGYREGDGLLFGNEGHGCPAWLHERVGRDNRVMIPRYGENLRSLNLASAAAIATYEALRQIRNTQPG